MAALSRSWIGHWAALAQREAVARCSLRPRDPGPSCRLAGWVSTDEFLDVLRRRLAKLGLSRSARGHMVDVLPSQTRVGMHAPL